MTIPIDSMTDDQLRDELARASGWRWFHGGNESAPCWFYPAEIDGKIGQLIHKDHPIPPLDSPEALGFVAGLMPWGWLFVVSTMTGNVYTANAGRDGWNELLSTGTTEIIARARLVLKVLAATKPRPPTAPPTP